LDNLMPICGVCNKSMRVENMIEFIIRNGYSADWFKRNASFDRGIVVKNAVLYPSIPTENYVLPKKIKCGKDTMYSGFYLLVADPHNVLNLQDEKINLSAAIPKNVNIDKLPRTELDLDILQKIKENYGRNERFVMKVLHAYSFDMPGDEMELLFYKTCHESKVIGDKYSDNYETARLESEISDELKIHIQNMYSQNAEEYIKNFMIVNSINCF